MWTLVGFTFSLQLDRFYSSRYVLVCIARQLAYPKPPRVAPLPWSGLHVLRFFHLLVSRVFLCPALVHLVFLKSQFTFEYISVYIDAK